MIPDNTLSEASSFSSRCSRQETVRKSVHSKLMDIILKLQMHLQGKKRMSLNKITELATNLASIENSVYLTDKSSVSTAKNILSRIRKQVATKSKTEKAQTSMENIIGWRTRSTNRIFKLKRKTNSLCSQVFSLPDSFPLELLTNNNFVSPPHTQESDVSMDIEISSSPAPVILVNDMYDKIEEVKTTDNDTQPSSVQISTEEPIDNFSSTSPKEISDLIQNSNFQESQAAQTNIESTTNPQSFDVENISNVPSQAPISMKIMPDEQEQILTTYTDTQPNSVQIGSKSEWGNSLSTSSKEISDDIQTSNFQESQADQTNIESDNNPHQEAFEAENTSPQLMEASQLIDCESNNGESSINITSDVLQLATVSPAPSHTSYFDCFKSFLEESNTDAFDNNFISEAEEFQEKESSISDETYGEETHYLYIEKEPVITQATNDTQTISYSIVNEDQQFNSSEASENQTNNSFCFTLPSQRNGCEPVEDNSDEGISSQANMENCTNEQSFIIIETSPTNCFDANVPELESTNDTQTISYSIVNEDQQFNSSEASENQTSTSFFFSLPSQRNEWEANIARSQPVKDSSDEAISFQENMENCTNQQSFIFLETQQTNSCPVTIINKDQQFTSSEASENQTTNSFCFTLPSQRNGCEPVEDNSDEGISFQANMENFTNHQSIIIPETQQTNYFDANVLVVENNMIQNFELNHDEADDFGSNVSLLENNMTQSIKLKPEPQQTNYLDADKSVQENMNRSITYLHVSLVEVDDTDLTDVGSSCSFEDDDQNKKETNSLVPETQASFTFGISKPESTTNNVLPAQQLLVTQTKDPSESPSTTGTIVPETIYTQSQCVYSKSPRKKCPYKNHTQSSSFLSYKATRMSQASLAKLKRRKAHKKKLCFPTTASSSSLEDNASLPSNSSSLRQEPLRNIFHYSASDSSSDEEYSRNTIVKVISQSQELQSQNLVLINGRIAEDSNSQNLSEELYSEKENRLVEKVMTRRERHTRDEWKEMAVSEKVSGIYADKFHVRIFDEPVEALTNICYKPCFSTSTFPRSTLREVRDGLTRIVNSTRKLDEILKNTVDKLKDQNCLDSELNFSKRLGIVESSDNSDSSDEERKANKRWLREYRAKTKSQSRCFMTGPEKEKPDFTSRSCRTLEIKGEKPEEEKDEVLMVDLMTKFGECTWLKNENV